MAVYVLIFVYYILCGTTVASKEHVCGKPLGSEFRLLEEDRIVAGYDIGYYRYPWYAALIRYSGVSCGGALIASKTVLTAAHCFKEFLKLANKRALSLESIYTVKLGVYNICEVESTQRVYSVEKVIIHDLYKKKAPYYDICILKLIGNTDSFRVICLPPPMLKKRPPDGTVPGLGTLRYHGAMPCTVHEARLLIHNDTTCHIMLNNTGNDDSSIVNAFCAGYLQGGIDTCQGDSGGPLQSMNEDGDFVLVGIVSFGFRCADPGLLGMYTDVSQYIDWIKEKSGPDQPISIDSFVQTPTSAESGVSNSNQGANYRPGVVLGSGDDIAGPNHHRRPNVIHIGRPYRRPVKVIIFKNNHLHLETQPLLHKPIIRYIMP